MIIYIAASGYDDFLAQLDRLSRIKKLGVKSMALQNFTVLINCDFSLSGKDLGIEWGSANPADIMKRGREYEDEAMTTAGFKRYSEDSKLWVAK